MKELLITIAKGLVSNPDAVSVDEAVGEDGTIVYTLNVDDDDKGRVIGKQGKIAKAIRTIVRSTGNKHNKKISVEIS